MVTTSTPVHLPSGPQQKAHHALVALLVAVAAVVTVLVLMFSASGTTTVDRTPLPDPAPQVTCPGAPPNAAC